MERVPFAFTNKALTGVGAAHPKWVGFANFEKMFSDPLFIHSLVLTVLFVVGSAVLGQNTLGFLIALIERGRKRWFVSALNTFVICAWVPGGGTGMSGTLTLGEDVKQEKAAAWARPARRRRFQITSPRKTMSAVAAYGVLTLVAIFFLAPLIWLVLAALELRGEHRFSGAARAVL